MVAKSMSISMLLAGVPASYGQRPWETINEQLEEAMQHRQLTGTYDANDFNDYCTLSSQESGESLSEGLEYANGVHSSQSGDGVPFGPFAGQAWADVGAWGLTAGEMENSIHARGYADFGEGGDENSGHYGGEVCVIQATTTLTTSRTTTTTSPWPTPAPTPACPTPAPGANTGTWILSNSGASCTEACSVLNEPCNECGMKAVTVNERDSLEHISNRLACRRSFCANVFEAYNPSIDSADMCCWAGQNSTCGAKKADIKRLCCCGTQCELPDDERHCLPPCKVKAGWCDCKTNDISSNTPQGATPVLALSMVISIMVLFRPSSFFS